MHDRISVNSACFPSAGFDRLAGCWRDVGAHRVSLVGPTIEAEGTAAVRRALATGAYQVETVVQPFLRYGEPVDPREESWQQPRARFNQFIDEVRGLGGRSIFTVSGAAGNLTWEEAASSFSAAVAPCIAFADQAGIALMIENVPPLYADMHIGLNLRDTMTLAEMAGIGLCVDLFSCWTEADLHRTLQRAVPRCHLVQIADYVPGDRSLPARAVPGDGAIPIKRMLDWILSAGYAGMFDIEMMGPRIEAEGPVTAVRRAADVLGEMLHSLGA